MSPWFWICCSLGVLLVFLGGFLWVQRNQWAKARRILDSHVRNVKRREEIAEIERECSDEHEKKLRGSTENDLRDIDALCDRYVRSVAGDKDP